MIKTVPLSGDEKLAVSKALDTVRAAEKHYSEKAFGFLDPHIAKVVTEALNGEVPPDIKTELFGGYDEAERRMLVCYPEYLEPDRDSLISALEITGRDINTLSHRDYLGSLMGLGITRDNIGDIVPLENSCIIFARPAMADYIISNLSKVGRCGIKIKKRGIAALNIPKKKTQYQRGTVSALRLDCLVAEALSVSRSKAADIIRAEKVKLNFETEKSVSRIVSEGDLISVRGFGRYKLTEICGITAKGRHSIIIEKYI